jgi:hypothetical protein
VLLRKHTLCRRLRLFYPHGRRRVRGVLCLAPIGRLACTTTPSSRFFYSALRSIRQNNNVNESCIKDGPEGARRDRSRKGDRRRVRAEAMARQFGSTLMWRPGGTRVARTSARPRAGHCSRRATRPDLRISTGAGWTTCGAAVRNLPSKCSTSSQNSRPQSPYYPVRLGVPKFICSEPTILAMSREVVMLTRRGFSGFAACATCGIGEFVAAEVSAQGTQPAATPGVTRKILSQMHGPAPGYVN